MIKRHRVHRFLSYAYTCNIRVLHQAYMKNLFLRINLTINIIMARHWTHKNTLPELMMFLVNGVIWRNRGDAWSRICVCVILFEEQTLSRRRNVFINLIISNTHKHIFIWKMQMFSPWHDSLSTDNLLGYRRGLPWIIHIQEKRSPNRLQNSNCFMASDAFNMQSANILYWIRSTQQSECWNSNLIWNSAKKHSRISDSITCAFCHFVILWLWWSVAFSKACAATYKSHILLFGAFCECVYINSDNPYILLSLCV